MLKKLIFAAITLSLISILGCSYFDAKLAKQPDQERQREQICSQLKRQMIFNESNISSDVEPASPTNEALLMRDYKHYKCDQL